VTGQSPGRFAGKLALATSGSPVRYLTTSTVRRGGGQALRLPTVTATAVTEQERCLLYAHQDGTLRWQLGGGLWIAFNADLGWLTTTADLDEAAAFRLGGQPVGASVEVQDSGWKAVCYDPSDSSGLLTVNLGQGMVSAFAPDEFTPGLDAIAAARGCPGGDLSRVDLRGQDLSGLDLTKAQLVSTLLDGAHFTGSVLAGAMLDGAVVGRATFDGAVLDGASFAGAHLEDAAWGAPKSAVGIALTGVHARRAKLGGQQKPPDCTGANLTGGDFREANLNGLPLGKAHVGGALLAGAHLDGATLDSAILTGVVASGATFVGASMRGVDAQSASFVGADLSSADLGLARLGARAFLFSVAGALATNLDSKKYAQPDLVQAFAPHIVISPEDEVSVVEAGRRWRLHDAKGPYDLLLSPAKAIDVFLSGPTLRPAVLAGALCRQTKAAGASLSGADLRGVRWFAAPATLDHADLTGAVLSGSMLAETDFTQAYLSGADLSGCVAVQAQFRGCLVGADDSRRALSLERALVQGADFSDSTLIGALLAGAAVALPRGVPLFTLPLADRGQLTTSRIGSLAAKFAAAGHPLGTAPTVSEASSWAIDNSGANDPSAPKAYRVSSSAGQYPVFDASGGNALFILPATARPSLEAATASGTLVNQFSQGGYVLAPGAPITASGHWEIRPSADANPPGPVSFPRLHVYTDATELPVYGSVTVKLRDWKEYSDGLAFSQTKSIDTALDPGSIGPSGLPRAWFDEGLVTWQQLMTAGLDADVRVTRI
jgi:uncharacterized protein YjbI with pentapeptide repeats